MVWWFIGGLVTGLVIGFWMALVAIASWRQGFEQAVKVAREEADRRDRLQALGSHEPR